MKQRATPYGSVGLIIGLGIACIGCASPSSSTTRIRMDTLCSAELDECREVELAFVRCVDRETGQPERRYDLIRLAVKPRKHLQFQETVKKVELTGGKPSGQCQFENVEARRDETGQKVWFVQRNTSRIIASVDLGTREATGPDDESPAWATPDGGELLSPPAE